MSPDRVGHRSAARHLHAVEPFREVVVPSGDRKPVSIRISRNRVNRISFTQPTILSLSVSFFSLHALYLVHGFIVVLSFLRSGGGGGGSMEAADILPALQERIATVPGSRDLDGRPLLVIVVQPWINGHLDTALKYYLSLYK